MQIFSSHLPKYRFKWIDVAIFMAIFLLLYAVLKLGAAMDVPLPVAGQQEISLDPELLPYYAGRSLLRMFIAFGASLVFTLIYGYLAAKNRWAERVLVPLLDILQSIPVLGFLSATITALMALFPGSLLGVEMASILAIFTGQVWNMTFSFYNSLKTIPKDMVEASEVLQLNWWQRFVKLEVPFSMIGLVWNSMMSFGGGWFFLAASEAISVLGQDIRLPGVGSYLATAIDAGNVEAIIYAIITMVLMIILVDQFFWRPLVVWSQRFKIELTESAEGPTSFVYDLLYRSPLISTMRRYLLAPLWKLFSLGMNHMATLTSSLPSIPSYSQKKTRSMSILKVLFFVLLISPFYTPLMDAIHMLYTVELDQLGTIIVMGFFTFGRVLVAILCSALWTIPVGVWIGLNPRVSRILQPVVQIAASFPANMLFPFVTILFLKYSINFQWGSIALMMLGTQWYILFNVIAGTLSIPNDLKEAGTVFALRGWKKWKTLILPSIFPYLVTGCITASGGAWNASIVSELVSWKDTDLVATGLGAYISQVTTAGDWNGIILGILVMCLFVVLLNRFIWRRLYTLAETKYHLD